MHSPKDEHLEAVCQVMIYQKKNPERGLLLKNSDELKVVAYTDADWVGSISDWRSTSKWHTFVGRNLVTWRGKKQLVITWNNVEAQYRVVAKEMCEELLWLKRLLDEP